MANLHHVCGFLICAHKPLKMGVFVMFLVFLGGFPVWVMHRHHGTNGWQSCCAIALAQSAAKLVDLPVTNRSHGTRRIEN